MFSVMVYRCGGKFGAVGQEAHDPEGGIGLARSEARIFTSIWKDEDFLALPGDAQRLYMFLLSQDDLSYCGVLPLRLARWARKARELTVAQLSASLTVLADSHRPFVVVDEETGELLVRSLIRHDGIWKQPNIMKAARESAAPVESPAIRAALLAELERIPARESPSKAVRDVHAEFTADLSEPCGNPSPNPSGKAYQGHAANAGYPQGGGAPDAGREQDAEKASREEGPASAQVAGIINPSPNPSANPSPNPSQGKGEGYGPVPQGSPSPLSPDPLPPGPVPAVALFPAVVAEVRAGGGGDRGKRTPQSLDALVAEVRAIRPAWSTKSVRRALDDESVTERPWPTVRAAMLAMARDPKSDHPGRLAHDGPWWRAGSAQASPARPPWCRQCDERTRWLDPDAENPVKCPRCHPETAKARTA